MRIGTRKHLTYAQAGILRRICLNIGDCAWLPTPSMVDERFRIHAEEPVEQILVVIFAGPSQRTPCNVSHGHDSLPLQFAGYATAHPPEIGERPVGPQQFAIPAFIEFGNAHAVLIRGDVLSNDIHRHFRQIQVRADACRGRDARLLENVGHDATCQFMGRAPEILEIFRDIDEHLVHRIHVDILFRGVVQIDAVDFRTGVQIV